MQIEIIQWKPASGWSVPLSSITGPCDLAVYFAAGELMGSGEGPLAELRRAFPGAIAFGCSTAGEICNATVSEGTLSAALVSFKDTKVRGACVHVSSAEDSVKAGAELGRILSAPDLSHVIVLSDGLCINGSSLTASLRAALPRNVKATGGLAGDGARFHATFVGYNDDIGPGRVAAIGLYGDKVQVSFGSSGGWQPFGPKRRVTGSKGNVLYSLDDQPALALYKRYLGDRASGLPATGLLFPLQVLATQDSASGLVRTILAIDEAQQSLTFAGDVPEGQFVRLMKAGCDALVDGAGAAAGQASKRQMTGERLALLVSCVGRRLVMGQRVEEEIEAVLSKLGGDVQAAGFYSYGEISPASFSDECELHNQTMTLTVIGEQK
ncbi:MAG: FIST N-terminal domain-containing protein [Opitutaceae bacterium]|jgi:hypothetical protein